MKTKQNLKLAKTELIPENSPEFFHRMSYEYINACEELGKSGRWGLYNNVQYYLVCHALEISMKSILIVYGWKSERLKREINHDLIKAVNELRVKKYKFNKEEVRIIKEINAFYSKKGFEYLEFAGSKVYPRIKELKELACKVIRDSGEIISNKAS